MAGYRPRMLQVTLASRGASKWEWQVCDSGDIVMSGFARTRSLAKHEGDSALFLLLAEGRFPNQRPQTP
jgi:hypothetical protein